LQQARNNIVTELGSLDSTKEQAAFFAAQRMSLNFASLRGPLGTAEQQPDGKMVVTLDKDRFENSYSELIAAGASPNDAIRAISLKYVPIAAHELRHAINHHNLAAQGTPFAGSSEDEEVLGHADGGGVWNEIRQRHPELTKFQNPDLDLNLNQASARYEMEPAKMRRLTPAPGVSFTRMNYDQVKSYFAEGATVAEAALAGYDIETQQRMEADAARMAQINDSLTPQSYTAIRQYYEREIAAIPPFSGPENDPNVLNAYKKKVPPRN
jgi:hypothetical protein